MIGEKNEAIEGDNCFLVDSLFYTLGRRIDSEFLYFAVTPNGSTPLVDCGSMSEDQQRIWSNFEFWCEGILFGIVGGFGLVGNLLSIGILSTK